MDLQFIKNEAIAMAAQTLDNSTLENAANNMMYIQGVLDLVFNLEEAEDRKKEERGERVVRSWDEVAELMHKAEQMLCYYREVLDGLTEKKQVVVDDSIVASRRMAINVWLRKKKELIGGE